jgi:hypothetical protein
MTTFEGHLGLKIKKKSDLQAVCNILENELSTTTGTPQARDGWDKHDDRYPKLDRHSLKVI